MGLIGGGNEDVHYKKDEVYKDIIEILNHESQIKEWLNITEEEIMKLDFKTARDLLVRIKDYRQYKELIKGSEFYFKNFKNKLKGGV